MPEVSFKKATDILTLLLAGKTPKEIAYELGTSLPSVTQVKKMFPLFAGLTQRYKHDE